jgi:hypothetical protein
LTFTSQGYDPPPSSSFSPVTVTIHLLPVHLRQLRLRSTPFQFIFASQGCDPPLPVHLRHLLPVNLHQSRLRSLSFQLIFARKDYDPPPSSSFSPVKVTIHLLPVHFRQSMLRSTSFQFIFACQGYKLPPSWSSSPVNVTIHVPSRSSSPAKGYPPSPVLFKYDGRRVVSFAWWRWFSVIWD